MKVIVQHNQSLFDIAIQYFGSAQAVVEVANFNDLSITEVLTAGQEIELPELSIYQNNDIVNYYKKNNIVPVTGQTNTEISTEEPLDGIGVWEIGSTFIIQ